MLIFHHSLSLQSFSWVPNAFFCVQIMVFQNQ